VHKYQIQNSPAVKKVCGPEEDHCEKDVKSKLAAGKGYDGRLMLPSPCSLGFGTKFT